VFKEKHMQKQQALLSLLLLVVMALYTATALATPLDDYVAKPEEVYAWRVIQSIPTAQGATIHQLHLTSQVWQGITWNHRLYVVLPDKPKYNTAVLYITGSGSGSDEIAFMSTLANTLSAPVAILFDIPNQPLFNNLNEDHLIAYTFVKFAETGDPTWPVLLPMTKGAVKAMDAVAEFAASKQVTVKDYLVVGGSKRGWTTWLSAAVDKRVRAIAPVAYDNLNLAAQMKRQVEAFGTFSEQISEYTDLDLPQLLMTKEGQVLANLVDPYAYAERLTLPKLIVRGTNDPYWPLDAVNLYLDDLPGNTWIHYDPNGGHAPSNMERVLSSVAGFYLYSVGALPLAPLQWNVQEGETSAQLTVQTALPAPKITWWWADSLTMDFRKATWTEGTAMPGQARTVTIDRPLVGYKAFYGEVVYTVGNAPVVLNTPVYTIGARK
jgi:PhoPQ-activated pathogenicity-related protein